MNLQLLAIQDQESSRPERVKPVDFFKRCPACGFKDLIDVGPDVLCGRCDWDSIAWDVARGGMADLRGAHREFGFEAQIHESEIEDFATDPTGINQEQGA